MINTYEHLHWKYAGRTQEEIEVYKKFYKKIFSELKIKRIHDCSCGSGVLTFPLIYLGFDVSGSDLSNKMIELANERAREESLKNHFFIEDFTKIDERLNEKIDCLISTGNSLAHVDNHGFSKFLSCASNVLQKNNYLYFDTRNWDKITENKQRFLPYKLNIGEVNYLHIMQVWDYNLDDTITFNILIREFDKDGNITNKDYQYAPPYYPLKYNYIQKELEKNGFKILKRYNFDLFNLWSKKNKIDQIQSDEEFKSIDWYSVLAVKAE